MASRSKAEGKLHVGSKMPRTRRSWNLHEEQVLGDLLSEAVLRGWKSDNGFKTGYLNWLENAIAMRYPNSKFTVVHINSKITGWKKVYGHIRALSQVSGLGWNEANNMVLVDDESVWIDYVRVHPEVENLRNKSYPLYPMWMEVFGRDRATGEQALGYDEAENGVDGDYMVDVSQIGSGDDVTSSKAPASTPSPSTNEDVTSKIPSSATGPTTNPSVSGKSSLSGKKRNEPENSTIQLTQVADDFLKKSETLFLTMVEKLGFGDMLFSEKTKVVTKAVEEFPNLSDEAMIFVTQKILKCPTNTETFLNYNKSRRDTFVKMLLEGKIM